MVENKLVFKDKGLNKWDSTVLGISGENEQEMLVFSFEDGFVDGTCYLEIEFPSGEKCSIEIQKGEELYRLEVKNSLLRQVGILEMQLKVVQETAVWKSITFKMHVLKAINAVETIEEQYPNWVDGITIRVSELEEGMKQIDKKIDDSNFVQDENYVHTDNNFTTEEKEKLDGLENYNDKQIKEELRK